MFLQTLMEWYVWMPVVAILIVLTVRNHRLANTSTDTIDSTLLVLEIPRANDKSEMAAEQLFASLHGILRDARELRLNGNIQEHLSFEIASVGGQIRFYVWTPKSLQGFVEGQIYAQYPTVQIHTAEEDYVAHERHHSVIYTADVNLIEPEFLPVKTFTNFEVDPLAGITGTLAKLEDSDDEIWIQILVRPIADTWHRASDSWIDSVRSGRVFGSFFSNMGVDYRWIAGLFEALWRAPEQGSKSGGSSERELTERDKTRISQAQEKATKLGYQVSIRIAILGENQANARLRMQAIVGTFKQFNSTNLNGFKMSNDSFKKEDLQKYKQRSFNKRGYILNIEELASVFHLPHTNVETPNIVWANTKTAEPPSTLPIITGNVAIDENISAFGLTNFRGINHQFGMLRSDRSRHVYIIGQTGAGKSGLLELFALSDIYHNEGYAIIDPHGDFAINNMKFVPASRIKDVIYFNPADTAFPLGFNPLEVTDPSQKNNISSEVIGVLKRMFGESWGPRLEYILRYTILALLDRPDTTMLDITRLLTDKKFRKATLKYCQDPVVLQFWQVEFASWTDRFAAEAIAPVLNKVGAFTANPIIRNIIGQPKSTFNIRKIMDEGKILVVNLSKGLIGEDNASILGSFLVTKIQLAAMSRSDIADIRDRRPFYLYVDEFQNFATDSFATILSEARKYGLCLTVANQYTTQMSETVRNAVFGNVGSMITFRVSADDAPLLVKQFEPQFESNDLLQMNNRNFVINMVIRGEKTPAFSASTLNLPPPQSDLTHQIIENTRSLYAAPREDVEHSIALITTAESQQQQKKVQQNTPKKQPQTETAPQSSSTQTPASTTTQQSHSKEEHKEAKNSINNTTETNTKPISSNASTSTLSAEATPAKKRRRSRTRKRKTPAEKVSTNNNHSQASTVEQKNTNSTVSSQNQKNTATENNTLHIR